MAGVPIHKVKSSVSDMEAVIEDATSHLRRKLSEQEAECESKLGALRSGLKAREDELSQATDALVKAEAQLHSRQTEAKAKGDEVDSLRSQVDAKAAEVQKGELSRAKAHEAFEAKFAQHTETMKQAQQLIDALEAAGFSMELGPEVGSFLQLAERSAKHMAAEAPFAKLLAAAQQHFKALRSEDGPTLNADAMARLRELLGKLADGVQEAMNGIKEQEKREADAWTASKEGITKEINALEARKAAVSDEHRRLQAEVALYTREADEKRVNKEQLTKQVSAIKDSIEEQSNSCDTTLGELRDQMAKREEELEAARQLHEILDTRHQELLDWLAAQTGSTGVTGATGAEAVEDDSFGEGQAFGA